MSTISPGKSRSTKLVLASIAARSRAASALASVDLPAAILPQKKINLATGHRLHRSGTDSTEFSAPNPTRQPLLFHQLHAPVLRPASSASLLATGASGPTPWPISRAAAIAVLADQRLHHGLRAGLRQLHVQVQRATLSVCPTT